MTLAFWQYNVYADIRRGSLGKGRQTTAELSKTAIFSVFAGNFFSETVTVRRQLFSDSKIQFRLCDLAYRCLLGTAPPYLADSLHRSTDTAAVADSGRPLQTRWPSRRRTVQLLETAHFQWLRREHGTAYRHQSGLQRH